MIADVPSIDWDGRSRFLCLEYLIGSMSGKEGKEGKEGKVAFLQWHSLKWEIH